MKADSFLRLFVKRFFLTVLVASSLLSVSAQDSQKDDGPAVVEEIDPIKLTAQRAALGDLSGENPFFLRESGWAGKIKPGEARLVQIQLFRRNEYQFWIAMGDRDAELNLNIYDGDGQIVESKAMEFDESNIASTRVRPESTGVFYVRVSLKTTIDTPQKWSMIYAYR